MPTDVAEGFERLRRRLLAGESGQTFITDVKTRATDPYDTHPALVDRLRALEERLQTAEEHDARPAILPVDDPIAFDQAFVAATGLLTSDVRAGCAALEKWATRLSGA